MASSITFPYPVWFVLLCLLLGAAYTLILYFRSNTFSDPGPVLKRWIIGMSVARFIVVSLIALMLLSPLLRSVFTQIEKPIVVMLHDNSSSILHGFKQLNSTKYREGYQKLINNLSSDFDVQQFSFGQEMEQKELDFKERGTNISDALDQVHEMFFNQNLGAVLMATDGIYNQGSNPLYAGNRLSVPLYSIALGDTSLKRDLILSNVIHNRIAYLGDRFSLRADIAAQNCKGETTTLNIYEISGGRRKSVHKETIGFQGDFNNLSRSMVLEANKPGIQHFRVVLSEINGELTLANNSQDLFIEVIDGRQKVLIVGASPHPDQSALKQAIQANDNYEVSIQLSGKFTVQSIVDYNLLILHQLPAMRYRLTELLKRNESARVPLLFVLGKQTHLPLFAKSQSAIQIRAGRSQYNEIQAVKNPDFSLFSLADETWQGLEKLPPLIAPFGEYKTAANTQTMMFQKIGSIVSQYPAVIFSQSPDTRFGILCGEGFWKWRQWDYRLNHDHSHTNEFINKIVQYLAVKDDKRKFRVNTPNNDWFEDESIIFDAELYDESYELVNTPDVMMRVFNETGEEFPYTFNKTDKAYALNAGHYPLGNYTWTAEVMFNGEKQIAQGGFSISELRLEAMNSTADHSLLYLLADRNGGGVYFPGDLESLAETLRSRQDLKPIRYSTHEQKPLIHVKWLFFLFLLLLSGEWFARKFQGAY